MEVTYARSLTADTGQGRSGRAPYYMGVFVLVATIFVRNLFWGTMPVIVILAVATIVALISDRDELCTLAVCCIPMSAAFQYKYFLFLCMIIYLLKYSADLRINSAVFPLVLMMFWELLHGFSGTFSIVEYARGFAELIFCTFLMLTVRRKVDYPLVCRMLAIVTICMASIAFLKLLQENDYHFEAIFRYGYRFGRQGEGGSYLLSYNANGLGFICNLSMVGLMQMNLVKRGTFVNYVLIAILFVFGVMTMSRSFIICFLLILCCYALARAGRNRKRVLRTVMMIAFVGALILAVYRFAPVLLELYLKRFMEDDLSGGRGKLFVFYNQHILSDVKYLLFGIGLQDITGKFLELYGDLGLNVPHNGIQEILVCWGLPGLLFFVWHLFFMLSRSKWVKSSRTHSFLNYIPLIMILVDNQSGQLITSENTLLSFSLAYLSLCWNSEREKNIVEERGKSF